jgi:helix-turn-helix protein
MTADEPTALADPMARKTWRTLEPLHAVVYFAPEAATTYATLGVGVEAGYFVTRAAPMGAVDAATVIATFFNFEPDLVRRSLEGAWITAPPTTVTAARLEVADEALRRMLGDAVESAEMARAAELARTAAEVACRRPEGRPLFAGHAALPWPHPAHLVLWHAQTLLREFRGDGHIAALVTHDLDPVEALVLHAASGEVAVEFLRATRGWPDADWQAAVERLTARGWLSRDSAPAGGNEAPTDGRGRGDVPALSPDGVAVRRAIEAATDRMAAAPYDALGEAACAELRALARPFSRTVVGASGFGPAGGRGGGRAPT